MPRRGRPAPARDCPGWRCAVCGDPATEKVRLLAVAVASAMAGRSIRSLAGEVGVDHSALSDLLAGRSWPDSRTVALLEVGLGRSLWPPHEAVDR